MKASVLFMARFYLVTVALMCCLKPVFMLFNADTYTGTGFADAFDVMCAGFAMDCSMAAYLTIIPGLLAIASQWIDNRRILNTIVRGYYWFVAALVAIVFVLDTALYGYWGFKLDTTPLFYFKSSPALAMASMTGWQIVLGTVGVAVMTTGVYFLLRYCAGIFNKKATFATQKSRLAATGVITFLTAFLFIPIRGGFTVATMNLSSAYYCDDNRLNHAAVNPMFSLMYASMHSDNLSDSFRYFSDEETSRLFAELNRRCETPDSTKLHFTPVLLNKRPDIYIIILESFSSHLFPHLGGEPIATGLDSIARTGISFKNAYASSFRTDRGIPAILSALPGPPTTSVMKNSAKAQALPSIASTLKENGWDCTYYYGGDANFTNMKAYLASTGFSRIVSDKDFSISQRMSKWGVHDAPLFSFISNELEPYNPQQPKLKVIQTSSSHEPFDVDRLPRSDNEPKQVTAFAYTDSCVTDFINRISRTDAWNNSLIVLVPDHWGCYPENLTELTEMQRIPIIFTGGVIENVPARPERVVSQTDIAASLLGMLNLPHSRFIFSNDVFDPETPQYAFFSRKPEMGLATDSGVIVYSLEADRPETAAGDTTGLTDYAKAYLREVYMYIDTLSSH